ncbi:MAG: SufS family cysteine desulfurase [bacterium]|nr:SufS family cysteine desulfurase [bacterium]
MMNYKQDFPLLAKNPVAYLDNAASTQKPKVVIDAISNFYETKYANVHRGLYQLSEQATQAYEDAREEVRTFIGAEKQEEIIFTSGTTASINLVANSLGDLLLKVGDVILLNPTDHHSNIIPWQLVAKRIGAEIQWFDITADAEIDLETVGEKITPEVKIIAVGHIANGSGIINPIAEIIEHAHKHDIPVVVDAAQSVPHLAIDVQKLDCDFLAFSGHKLCGPTGSGVLYGKEKWLERMEPWQGGGEMMSEVSRTGATWAELPAKFEAGTPNIAGAIGLAAAMKYLNGIGMDVIHDATNEIYKYLMIELQNLDYITVLGTSDMSKRNSIASFKIAGAHPHDIAQILDDNQVAVRAGHHCAQLLMECWNVVATTRASVYFYNDKNDVDLLIAGLQEVNKIFK